MQEPSTSGSADLPDSLLSEIVTQNNQSKGDITNALKYCMTLLKAEDLLTDTPPEEISAASIAIGEEIFKEIMLMLAEKKIIQDDNLITAEESDSEEEYEECMDEPSNSSPEFMPVKEQQSHDHIPLTYKEKAVALAEMHPKWSLKVLQRQGCSRLKNLKMLRAWKNDVKRGGSHIDKWLHIETQTFECFKEARQCFEQVTTRTLQQWAMAIANEFHSDEFTFSASGTWVNRFKRKYRIRQRKITRFVSSREYASMEEILEGAEKFRTQTKALIPNFNLNYVINTDQTGCQYQITYNRSLAEKSSKTVLIKKKSLHDITHSYTAQYTVTASGEVLPSVFLCMQEPTGKFGPNVNKKVQDLMCKYKNVFVTCSKSGKLTKMIYKEFLINCLSPYVEKNKFLLLIDSWGGQTDATMYDEIFEDEEGGASCNIKVIPPKCTPLCQPCDVYFYRQIKNFIKRLQNAPALLQELREIGTREDAIKIHSLILHQLRAPIFKPMILYAWYAARLSGDKPSFLNVNEVCFPITILKKPCECKNVGFMQCAHCKLILCFNCFYDKYHPEFCKPEESDNEEDYE